MNITSDIHSLFVLLLALFTLGATILASYTFANVIRLRNVRTSWKSGRLYGYPLFSTLFLCSSAVIAAMVFYMQLEHYFAIMGCYTWMGVTWFLSSYFTSKSYITDHGIVKNINDPSQTIAWHQITDYVEKPASRGSEFVFIYQSFPVDEILDSRLIRLELFVPDRKIEKFNKIVSLKIGKTMTPVADSTFNFKTFE